MKMLNLAALQHEPWEVTGSVLPMQAQVKRRAYLFLFNDLAVGFNGGYHQRSWPSTLTLQDTDTLTLVTSDP